MCSILSKWRGESTLLEKLLFDKIAKFNPDLITVYGDAHLEGKTNFLDELARIYHDNPLPCLVGGDFNIIGKSCEKNKSNDTDH